MLAIQSGIAKYHCLYQGAVASQMLSVLQSFFNTSNVEIKTVQCMVKRLNLRKLSEIRKLQKNFTNYQLASLIDHLRSLFSTAQNWLGVRGVHYVSLEHCKTCIITTENSLFREKQPTTIVFLRVYEETYNIHLTMCLGPKM